MSAKMLHGLPVARALRERTGRNVARLRAEGVEPRVAVVVATDNESTGWYVRSIAQQAAKASIRCDVLDLGPHAEPGELAQTLRGLAADEEVHGIILQTPLPAGVDVGELVALIPPVKDLDGANPLSFGRLSAGLPAFAAATAQAVIEVLDHYEVPLSGEHAVVVGRSMVVGKPLAQLLLHRDATVSVCHSQTPQLAEHTLRASVVVAAAGRAGLLDGGNVRSGSVVVDVGTNVDRQGNLIGDVESSSVQGIARALTPVPGGVGTVTTALLLLRTTRAALESVVERQ
ncbi:5,10-methylene-tetrahydrofolate cyclohydrolase [Arthrobacter sp. YC-RL1]|uniref:bifunctional 5,10-methylenetetrahydrofolate dehydrogenase/5,10-methenyltetrahydrofolate cyclohydrolase n=1 Tax=Arthrobacter sp. YC-RL1 TaxID=1652545 RepID=UPI00063DA2A8|nr:bifunctional 5,10-methylenetetrahydrofolate dehydrogenase/5,10-methenyltetrahydrofolate cyclohydrolase [Arthrobacter sp. YC-RL1]ALQ29372.1 bifunctional 5,10-methylene-tetrahydrofolate dehydrogenase/5,10-methylene-tetrahydrofolate cyclohydrolase [Arthrobacter sp. YC-RL1]KLI89238.1 5,10-methylene-tetrahydrofolate cyclohydrolase [Arthrobacter sp. YC-RL1]